MTGKRKTRRFSSRSRAWTSASTRAESSISCIDGTSIEMGKILMKTRREMNAVTLPRHHCGVVYHHHHHHHHPGVAIQKYLNENYFEPLAKLASKHKGTVLNFAGDAACCVFRERRRCDGTRETDDEDDDENDIKIVNGDETKARVTKRAESFAEEVVNGRWLFSEPSSDVAPRKLERKKLNEHTSSFETCA